MLCPEEMAEEDLLDFILKGDAPAGDLLEKGDSLLEDWGLLQPEAFGDKEVEDFLSGFLSPFLGDSTSSLSASPPRSDSSLSEAQKPSGSPSSWDRSPSCTLPSSESIQTDHSYCSLNGDLPSPVQVSVEGDVAINLEMWGDIQTPEVSSYSFQSSDLPVSVSVEDPPQGRDPQWPFPPLMLSEEEQRLLEKEGVAMPSHLPLTKAEERILKRVRRKIRNKQSAQDSRRRKKVYVDSLESRVVSCTAQNNELQKKVQLLQKQNTSLLDQLRKLQALVQQLSNKTTTARTCAMVLLLSFALILSPTFYPFGRREQQSELQGVLSRQLREYSSNRAHLQGEIPQATEARSVSSGAVLPSQEMRPGDVLRGAATLNRSLEGSPRSPEAPPASTINSNASADPSARPEGLPPTVHQPPGEGPAFLSASVADEQRNWVDHTTSVVIQPRHSDEM